MTRIVVVAFLKKINVVIVQLPSGRVIIITRHAGWLLREVQHDDARVRLMAHASLEARALARARRHGAPDEGVEHAERHLATAPARHAEIDPLHGHVARAVGVPRAVAELEPDPLALEDCGVELLGRRVAQLEPALHVHHLERFAGEVRAAERLAVLLEAAATRAQRPLRRLEAVVPALLLDALLHQTSRVSTMFAFNWTTTTTCGAENSGRAD